MVFNAMKTVVEKVFFYILSCVLNDYSIEQERLCGLSSQDWEEVPSGRG